MVIKSRRAYESDDISSFVNRKTTVNHNNVLNNEMPKSSFHQRRHSEGEFRKKVNLRQNCEQRHHPAEESHARKNHIPKIMFQTPPRPKSNINRQKCKSTGARALIKNCHFRERQFSTAGSNKSVVDQNMFCTPPKPRAIIFEERCHSTGDCKRRIFQDNDSALANSDIRDKSLPKTEFRCASKPISLTLQQRSKCTKDDKRRHCAQNETRLNRYLPMTGNIHQSYRQNPFEDEKDSKDQYQKPKSLFNNLEKMQEVSFGSARTSFLPRSEIINFQSSEHDTRDATNENRSQRLTYKRDKAPPNQSSPLIAHRDGDISNHIRTTSQPENFIIRSSEMEPTLHQMNIPPAENIVIHSRVCSMMERYDVLKAYQGSQDKLFDFSELIGLSRSEIRRNTWNNAIISNVTPDIDDMDLKDTVFPLNQKLPMNKDKGRFHPSVVKALFDCADDLVVEGYFQSDNSSTGSQEESKENTRIQASVFSSHKHRQFIVCFRGSDEEQAKPISKSKTNQQLGEKESLLHPNQPVSIHPKFRATYFTKQIEMQVFRLLIDLSDFNPFYDVVMTGHSYGGALATIGAIRFAALFPMMTVSCHAFGTPKVGGIAFRHFANSLPNLKVRPLISFDLTYFFFILFVFENKLSHRSFYSLSLCFFVN